MKSSKKKKALLLTAVSSMTLAAAAVAISFSSKGSFLKGSAGAEIPGSVSYSYTTVGHKAVTSLNHSFKKTTERGTDIYLYSENNYSLNSKLVASFGSSGYASKFFTFTKDENGTIPFTFQNVTSLSITTDSTSAASASFSIYTSKDAASPSYSGSIGSSETQDISQIAGASYIKFVPTSSSFLDIKSITLNYSCNPEVQPGEKTLVRIRVDDGAKKNYAVNSSFIEPVVYADYVQDEVESSEQVNAEFSGYDMTSLGVQTVTASFGGKTAQYEIHVKPTEQSKSITYKGYSYLVDESREVGSFLNLASSTLPVYGEPGETLSFTPVFKSGYSYTDSYDEGFYVDEFVYSAGIVSFTVPSFYDVDVVIVFEEVLTLDRMYVSNPKKEYSVGSSFVIPTVVGVYTNPEDSEFESNLSVNASNFSGFDSSTAVASQTITVSYPGIESVTYTVAIIQSSEQYLEGTYVLNYDSSIKWKLEFSNDGTGIYRKYNSGGSVIGTDTFEYSFDGTNVEFTNVTCTYDNWGNYYLTYGTGYNNRQTSNTGTVSDDVISITTYNTSGSVTRAATYTKAAS